MSAPQFLGQIFRRSTVRQLFDAHPILTALGGLETRHLPHLSPAALVSAVENAGVDDLLVDRLADALEEESVLSAFALPLERPLLGEEVVELAFRVAPSTSSFANVILIDQLHERLLHESGSWKTPPKVMNFAFCRLGSTPKTIQGIKDAVAIVLAARKRLGAEDAGLIIDLCINALDDCDEARRCVAELAALDGVAYVVIMGQDLDASVALHQLLLAEAHLDKAISMLHDALVGVRFPGSQELCTFADEALAGDARDAYLTHRGTYEALQRDVRTPAKVAEAALAVIMSQ